MVVPCGRPSYASASTPALAIAVGYAPNSSVMITSTSCEIFSRDDLARVPHLRLGVEKAQLAPTLPDTDHDLFLALKMSYLVLVAALGTADKGLINLNCPAQLGPIFRSSHRGTNAVAQIPCWSCSSFCQASDRPH